MAPPSREEIMHLVGAFASPSVDFGGGPISRLGSQDAYVVKMNGSGTHLWSDGYGGTSASATAFAVALNPMGSVYVAGFQGGTGSVDYGGGGLTAAGGVDATVWAVDFSGSHLWSKIFGDAATQLASGIASDSLGNAIVTGHANGSIDFGGGALTSAGSSDVYVAKLGGGGAHVWSQIYGDSAAQTSVRIATDASDNVLGLANFDGSIDFGGGPLTSLGSNDAAVFKLTSAGAHVSSVAFGDSGEQTASSIAGDGSGNRYVTGGFAGTVDFGDGPLMSSGGSDLYVVKMAP
jgi:hypothetical protein